MTIPQVRRAPEQRQGVESAIRVVGRAANIVILAAMVLWMGLAWWSAPRAVDIERLEPALSAGEVTSYARAEAWSSGSNWGWANRQGPPMLARNGALVVWQTTSGQTFYAAPGLELSPPELVGSGGGGRDARTDAAVEQLDAAGVPSRYEPNGTLERLALAVGVLGLCTLLFGRDPRRGTRWFWFWVTLAPGGLGVLAWLAVERFGWIGARRSPAAGAVEATAGRDRRWWGPQGLGVLFVSTVATAFVVLGLRSVFGPWVIPG